MVLENSFRGLAIGSSELSVCYSLQELDMFTYLALPNSIVSCLDDFGVLDSLYASLEAFHVIVGITAGESKDLTSHLLVNSLRCPRT